MVLKILSKRCVFVFFIIGILLNNAFSETPLSVEMEGAGNYLRFSNNLKFDRNFWGVKIPITHVAMSDFKYFDNYTLYEFPQTIALYSSQFVRDDYKKIYMYGVVMPSLIIGFNSIFRNFQLSLGDKRFGYVEYAKRSFALRNKKVEVDQLSYLCVYKNFQIKMGYFFHFRTVVFGLNYNYFTNKY